MSASPPKFRPGLFVGGNAALFVFTMLTTPYPEGNPAAARQAAQIWAELQRDVVDWAEAGDAAEKAITSYNGGKGIEAFSAFWKTYASPAPPAKGDGARLADFCDRMSKACDEYADLVDKARHQYWTLALANYASFLFISLFPWMATAAYEWTQIIMRRLEARLLAKLLENAIAKTVLAKFMEYSMGSAFFAVGDVLVMDSVKALRGEDVGSWSDNFEEVGKEWLASVAFYGVFDAYAKPVALVSSNKDVQYFLARFAGGSIGYGPVYGYLNGKRGEDLMPTGKDDIARTLLYVTMAHKPAG